MIGFLGYNFFKDGNAVDPFPTNVTNITITQIQNGIFDHLNVSSDASAPYSSVPPTEWDYSTIMDCDFNGNINAGNIEAVISNITSIKVKRRVKGTFVWTTIKIIPITTFDDLIFSFSDNLLRNDTEYEYAFVPVISGVEGDYLTNTIISEFAGVFLCDVNTIYKFYAGVEYGTNEAVQKIGTFEPFGRQYPVVISNSNINYQKGSVKGTILPENYLNNPVLNRKEMVAQREILIKFLNNKKPKILKDWNGNSWLVFITGNPNTSYVNEYGMGIANIDAPWTEVGSVDSNHDLYANGLIPTED